MKKNHISRKRHRLSQKHNSAVLVNNTAARGNGVRIKVTSWEWERMRVGYYGNCIPAHSHSYVMVLTTDLHRESKKTRHQTLGHNFTNYYPIFKIFSVDDSAVNLQQNHRLNIPQHFKRVATLPCEI